MTLLVLTLANVWLLGMAYSSSGISGKSDNSNASMGAIVDVRNLPNLDRSAAPQAPLNFGPRSSGGGPSILPRTVQTKSAPTPSNVPLYNTSSTTVTGSAGFDGLVMFQSCPCFPPDPNGAVGPNHIFEMVNVAGEIFTKAGAPVKNFTLASFFNTGADFISDPRIIFDSSSGRWFASILSLDKNFTVSNVIKHSNVTFAVSTSNDPTSSWTIYNIDTSPNLPDQPIIGVSDDKFVLSTNDYNSNLSVFLGAQYWIVNKNDLTTGSSSPRVSSFGPFLSLESVHPVQSLSSTTTQYMVTVGAGDIGTNSTTVRLVSITGVPGVSTVNNASVIFSVNLISIPPPAAEPSTIAGPTQMDTGDFRIQSAVWSSGKLWMGLNDACQGVSCVRLTQIDTTASSVKQDFDFFASGVYYFYPALSIDGSGNLQMVFGYSASGIYPSLAITGQKSTDPAGSLALPVTIKQGNGVNYDGRYGDYFGAGVDPSDTSVVWVVGQYHTRTYGGCDIYSWLGETCWATFIDSMSFNGFTMSATPTSVSFNAGSSAQSTINITSVNGFSGTVALTTASPNGLTVSCNPSSLSLTTSAVSTCTFASSTPGIYSVTTTAASGNHFQKATFSVTVAGFGITATPSAALVRAGSSTNLTIGVSSINGLAGTVNLASSVSPIITNGPTASLNTTSVTISSFSSHNAILTVSTTSQTPSGLFTVSVTGTSGAESHIAAVTIGIPPLSMSSSNSTTFVGVTVSTTVSFSLATFSLSGNPTSIKLVLGTSGTSTVTLNSLNGFAGSVSLSRTFSPVPRKNPPTVTLSPTTVTLPSGGSSTSTLTFSTASKTPTGIYTVNVTATAGPEVHSILVKFNVTTTLAAALAPTTSLNVSAGGTQLLGPDPSVTYTVTGSATVLATNATDKKHPTLFSMTYPLTSITFTSTTPGVYQDIFILNVGVSPYPLSSDIIITMTGSTKTMAIQVTRNVDINANGSVDTVDSNILNAALGCSTGNQCYNPRGDLNADGTVNSADNAILNTYFGAPDFLPDFTISGPTFVSIPYGVVVNVAITLTSTNGFSGTVYLATTDFRMGLLAPYSGLGATFASPSLILTPGSTATVTLSLSSVEAASHTLVVTGTSGSFANKILISVLTHNCNPRSNSCPF